MCHDRYIEGNSRDNSSIIVGIWEKEIDFQNKNETNTNGFYKA